MWIRRFLFAAVVVGMVVAAGCTKDDAPTFTRQDLIDELTGPLGMSDEQATCIADKVDEQGIPLDAFGQEVESDENLDQVISPEDQAKLAVIISQCAPNAGIQPGETPTESQLEGGADSTAPTVSVDPSEPSATDG